MCLVDNFLSPTDNSIYKIETDSLENQMKSMTGYGTAKMSADGIDIQVEIKSVNSRFLDLRVYLPRELSFYEYELRKFISASLKRGAIDVRVNYNDNREPKLKLNAQKLKKYHEIVTNAIEIVGLNDSVSIEYLLNEPGVIESENNLDNDPCLKDALDKTLAEATRNLIGCTIAEGEDMKRTLSDSMDTIIQAVKELESSLSPYKKQLFENMHTRIKELLSHFKIDTLEQRLVQELALYIDKLDVQEELTRLYSHIETFKSTILHEQNEDIGKTLNFIVQEMQREANTLGSKYSTSLSFKYILIIKEEIEKDREIIQNVA